MPKNYVSPSGKAVEMNSINCTKVFTSAQPAKMDLNKRFFSKQNTIQTFNIDV